MATSPGVGLVLKFIDKNDIKLGKVLGRGGFGTVYRATHVNWGRVAVKRLLNIKVTESLQKEADKMVRSLTSPYLVRIMGLIETPNGVDIVMEFFEYGSLKEFEEKYMKCECWARKVKMIQDIAYGMNFLHTSEPPITHCDLKLENVFVAAGFRAKIGDFGLAVSSTKSRLNAGESGTISHMPPEAFETAQVVPDEAWDIFTFGITTYELTSGCDPWPQMRTFANEKLVAIWVGKGERPNLEAIPSDAPTELVDIITSCWVAKSSERPRFINILDKVTVLFETDYEHNLRKADRAISEQMDLVQDQESSERKASTDSGWGSLEVRRNSEQQQDKATLAQSTSSSRDEEASTADMADGAESDQGNMDSMSFKEQQQTATTDESACAERDEGSSFTDTNTETSGTEAGLERQELGVAECSGTDRDEESQAVETDKGMQWQYKHTIDTPGCIYSCRWINPRHLAVCMKGCVKVYEVTTTSSHLAYTITSKRWKPLFGQPKEVRCTAVSEALPGSMLVICEDQPFVYQFPCHEATKEITRHKMKGDGENPYCIVANSTVAIISTRFDTVLIVFNLPDFTYRSKLSIDGIGLCMRDLSINSEHLLVMFDHKIVVRSLAGDMMENVCEIQPPERKGKARQDFCSVCCVDTDSRELYAVYEEVDERQSVYKYILSESGDGKEIECMNTGRVIGGEYKYIRDKGLSLTSDGMMALSMRLSERVNLYILE